MATCRCRIKKKKKKKRVPNNKIQLITNGSVVKYFGFQTLKHLKIVYFSSERFRLLMVSKIWTFLFEFQPKNVQNLIFHFLGFQMCWVFRHSNVNQLCFWLFENFFVTSEPKVDWQVCMWYTYHPHVLNISLICSLLSFYWHLH